MILSVNSQSLMADYIKKLVSDGLSEDSIQRSVTEKFGISLAEMYGIIRENGIIIPPGDEGQP